MVPLVWYPIARVFSRGALIESKLRELLSFAFPRSNCCLTCSVVPLVPPSTFLATYRGPLGCLTPHPAASLTFGCNPHFFVSPVSEPNNLL